MTRRQPPERSRRGRRWDEDSIRQALTEFLRGRTRWPTYDEFAAAGLKGLRDVLPRFGGPERWSEEMGLEEGPRAWGGVVRWTDKEICAALIAFLEGRETWPTHREFRRAGLGGLYAKLLQEHTLQAWAAELGVPAPQPGRTPNRKARQPAVRSAPALRRQLRWTDERIKRDLTVFLAGRDEWPRYREFVDAGYLHLYKAILNHGGTIHWAKQMGVRKPERRPGKRSG